MRKITKLGELYFRTETLLDYIIPEKGDYWTLFAEEQDLDIRLILLEDIDVGTKKTIGTDLSIYQFQGDVDYCDLYEKENRSIEEDIQLKQIENRIDDYIKRIEAKLDNIIKENNIEITEIR